MKHKRTRRRLRNLLIPLVLAGLVAVGLTAARAGQDVPSVETIVEKSNRVAYYQGGDGRARVSMRIVDPQGRTRTRELTILRWDHPAPDAKEGDEKSDEYTGDQRFYVYFHRPPDVEDMVLLVWKHVQAGVTDDRWLYMPALDLVKRIAATDERTSFVGSNFFYEDISGRNITEDTHSLADVTDQYYVLKNVPKEPERVEFAHYKMWIHKDTFLPIMTRYYDEQGNNYRTYEVQEVENIQGFTTVTKSRMTNERTGGYTVLEYEKVKYNVGIPQDIFSKRYLRQPPREYLQ